MHLLNTKTVVNRNLFFAFLILLATIAYGYSVHADENYILEDKGLELTIKAVDQTITLKQPMKIELRFSSSKGLFRIYKHRKFGVAAAMGPSDWLSFKMVSPNGIVLNQFGSRLPGPKRPYKGDHIDIAPNAPYRETINIFPNEFEPDVLWPEIGTYQLKAIYSYRQDNNWEYGRDLWQGKIESNWITVPVTQ